MKEIKTLTRSEFQVMSILWNLPTKAGCAGDILARYEDPKPAYTTLATFLKILTNKGFVNYVKKGNKLYYTPTVPKSRYAEIYLAPAKDIFFDGSFIDMIRFFIKKAQPTDEELTQLEQLAREAREK